MNPAFICRTESNREMQTRVFRGWTTSRNELTKLPRASRVQAQATRSHWATCVALSHRCFTYPSPRLAVISGNKSASPFRSRTNSHFRHNSGADDSMGRFLIAFPHATNSISALIADVSLFHPHLRAREPGSSSLWPEDLAHQRHSSLVESRHLPGVLKVTKTRDSHDTHAALLICGNQRLLRLFYYVCLAQDKETISSSRISPIGLELRR